MEDIYYCPFCGHKAKEENGVVICEQCEINFTDDPNYDAVKQTYKIGDEVFYNNKKHKIIDVKLKLTLLGLYEDYYKLDGVRGYKLWDLLS